jgi:hypothetical protein
MESVAKTLKLELRQFEVRGPTEFDRTITEMIQRRVDAIIVQGDTMFSVNAQGLAHVAHEHRLRSAGIPEYAEAGGMIGF